MSLWITKVSIRALPPIINNTRKFERVVPVSFLHTPFSTHAISMPNISKAFPSYTIWGHTGALVFKPLPPQYKIAQPSGGLVLAQKGKMAVELVPRSNSNTHHQQQQHQQHAWKQAIRYVLTPEDVGLILNALPSQQVELSNRVTMNDESSSSSSSSLEQNPFFPITSSASSSSLSSSDDTNSHIERVLKLTPASSGASIQVSIDFVKDGMGGVLLPTHLQKYGTPGSSHPLHVDMQAGEWIVVKSLLEYSIPYLMGWTEMIPLNHQHSIMEAQNPSYGNRFNNNNNTNAYNNNNNFFGNRRGYSTTDMPSPSPYSSLLSNSTLDEYNLVGGQQEFTKKQKRNTSKISSSDSEDLL